MDEHTTTYISRRMPPTGRCPPRYPGESGKPLQITASAISNVGYVRPNNEDNYILAPYMDLASSNHSHAAVTRQANRGHWWLAGVFDGIGGGEMGELAAREAAEVFLHASRQISDRVSKDAVDQAIRSAFLEANGRVLSLQNRFRILGTTGTLLCTDGTEYKLYHLGDSRAYRIRDQEVVQLTKDQTLAQMKLTLGLYRSGDPGMEKEKHILTEYIGCDRTGTGLRPVESPWSRIQNGDLLLLCTDGLYDLCTDAEIAQLAAASGTPGQKNAKLIEQALSHGGTDNVTCLLVSFQPG